MHTKAKFTLNKPLLLSRSQYPHLFAGLCTGVLGLNSVGQTGFKHTQLPYQSRSVNCFYFSRTALPTLAWLANSYLNIKAPASIPLLHDAQTLPIPGP